MMKLKMHYSKIFIIAGAIISLTCNVAAAENWINVDNNNKRILLDTDSINSNSNGVYYNVRYYEEKIKEDIVVTIQSKNLKTGVVSSCKFSEYTKKKNLADTITYKTAKSLKELNTSSLLYYANIKANSLIGNDLELNSNKKDEIKEANFGPYMRELQRRIKMNWEPPRGVESKQVVLLFKIAKNGRLLSCKVFKSSGVYEVDKSALTAVQMAAPFRELPAEFKGESIDIQFTFDYNIK